MLFLQLIISCSLYSVEKQNYLTTASFLKTYQKAKDNFKWFCDECLTCYNEENNKTKDDCKISLIESKLTKIEESISQIKNSM